MASDESDEVTWQAALTWCPWCGYVYATVVPLRQPVEECPYCGEWHPTPAWRTDIDYDVEVMA